VLSAGILKQPKAAERQSSHIEKPAYISYDVKMGVNIKFKDTAFSFLFSDPDVLRELYFALTDIILPAELPITINTLKRVLYNDRINDISFVAGDKLVVLIEHQSTINQNIPLRLLMYIAQVYDNTIEAKNIYGTKLIKIPKPEFYVLYNGTAPYPDDIILRLSDAFANGISLGLPQTSHSLDLEVKVINVNQGRNEKIVRQCQTLYGYSFFVGKIREIMKEGHDLESAMNQAVNFCIEKDVLKSFFMQHSTEVVKMFLTEWKMEDALTVRYEEGLEDGMEKGREEIARNALNMGASCEFVKGITGLDMEIIEKLALAR
jgi:hypothetical protein